MADAVRVDGGWDLWLSGSSAPPRFPSSSLVRRRGPALEVFERLVLIGERAEPGAAARSCAERLAGAFGGRVTEGGLVTRCQPGVMREASLVVMATDGERPSWTITDAVARALNACERPVLFVPAH